MFPVTDLGLLPESAAEHHGEITLCADAPWTSACRTPQTVSDFATVVADYADRLWAAGGAAGRGGRGGQGQCLRYPGEPVRCGR